MICVVLSPKIYLIIAKVFKSCYQLRLTPSKRPFMIPAKPIVFIESNLEYKISYLAAVGDSDKLKRQDQPSPGQYIYKVNRCLARYSPRATTTNRPTTGH